MATMEIAGPHGVRLHVRSVAGEETCVVATIDGLTLAVDMGCVPDAARRAEHVFVTHTHIDHYHGVTKHAALRRLGRTAEPATYVCAPAAARLLGRAFALAEEMQASELPHRVAELEPGDELALRQGVTARAFATVHRVPSQGYLFTKRVSRLLPELVGRPGQEIAAMRRSGAEIHQFEDVLLLCVTGDTTAEALDRHPECYDAKILVVECTFVSDDYSPERAHEKGHTHLDDLARRADRFRNEMVVLMHFSARHSAEQIREAVRAKLPEVLWARCVVVADGHG